MGAAGSSNSGALLDCCTSKGERPNKHELGPSSDVLQLHHATIQGDEP